MQTAFGYVSELSTHLNQIRNTVEEIESNACKVRSSEIPDYTVELVKAQVDTYFGTLPSEDPNIPEDHYIREVFDKYAKQSQQSLEKGDLSSIFIHKEDLLPALREFGRAQNETEEFFHTMDINDDGLIDFAEFKRAVKEPSAVEQWANSVPIDQLLAKALPMPENGGDPLRIVSRMTHLDIDILIEGLIPGLRSLLLRHIKLLTKALHNVDEAAKNSDGASSHKYLLDRMSCGTIEDFHAGLQGRIGQPHVKFEKAMKAEHCQKIGYNQSFTTPNYKITTTPLKEWKIVLGEEMCPQDQMTNNRKVHKLQDLCENTVARKSNLTREEVIAIVLYTGPMVRGLTFSLRLTSRAFDIGRVQYVVYNTILRNFPKELYNAFQAGNNLFTTTIFVLVSAVQKIARVMKMPRGLVLYRGLGGTVNFPDSFFRSDEHGCRGFAEWGFMSTTSNKEVALNYSGVRAKNPLPTVLQIRVGAADRGACIRDFSQYENEIEYLWVPCSFVEQDGSKRIEVTKDGIVEVYPVKVNANVKTSTTEELLAYKKKMHVAAFGYLVDEVERDLMDLAEQGNANARLERDQQNGKHTVEEFLQRIVQQCREVLERHDKVDPKVYTNDRAYRSLVLEMVDVKTWALSKLHEWLENPCAPLCYRFEAALRTVHRRRIAFLDRSTRSAEYLVDRDVRSADSLEAFEKQCKVTGLITDKVDETNELGETRLMAAAAEGRSMRVLRALVGAGADVNHARPDGVTAVWLAAQFGHAGCIKALAELRASVSQAANDGATPVYIAAQGGNVECIELLAALGADIKIADKKKGLTALHQAAMNGNDLTIKSLALLRADLGSKCKDGKSALDYAKSRGHSNCAALLTFLMNPRLEPSVVPPTVLGTKKLVISSGEISDVDGFFALSEYAKSGADVLFMMNYPAYVGIAEADADPEYAKRHPGLGYKYSAKDVFDKTAGNAAYDDILKRYDSKDQNEVMKRAMTDCAYYVVRQLWKEVATPSGGELFFCIGGINAINPFSPQAVKNDIVLLSRLTGLRDDKQRLCTDEGTIYKVDGQQVPIDLTKYSEIFMDFNGSMAYFNQDWVEKLSEASMVSKIQGVFIMGGVDAHKPPQTLPSIPDVLNRFSSATMNQFYHPKNCARFFTFLAQNASIPVHTVTNNVVEDLTIFADPLAKTQVTLDGIATFLSANGLTGNFLKEVATSYYSNTVPKRPAQKPYDFYTALALRSAMESMPKRKAMTAGAYKKRLFYSESYGMTLVSRFDGWTETLQSYVGNIETAPNAADNEESRSKKEYFLKEIAIMRTIELLPSLVVHDLHFEPLTMKLSLKLDSE